MIAPSDNDVETPKPMLIIDIPSMTSPSLPKIFLPKTGYRQDRIVNGNPRCARKIKW